MQTHTYLDYINKTINELATTQTHAIDAASVCIADALARENRVFAFGSGHSHMIAEEFYARAGGLASIEAILPPELMLHGTVGKSTQIERISGYAKPILELHNPRAGDVIIVTSNSGRNNVPVEMCLEAKALGMHVIAITSMKHSGHTTSRHESGLRMFEIADITIDNLSPAGDAAFYIEGFETPTGALSNIIGLTIAQTLVVNVVDELVRKSIVPPVFKSSNLDGADAYNDALFDTYLR